MLLLHLVPLFNYIVSLQLPQSLYVTPLCLCYFRKEKRHAKSRVNYQVRFAALEEGELASLF